MLYTKTCLYTMTPDRNFIIERLRDHPQIAVGRRRGARLQVLRLIGQILADLAVEGDTRYPIAPFTSNRPAIMDPAFEPEFRLVSAG